MTPHDWMHLARLALAKGASAARTAQLAAADETTKHALEAAAEYMEAIIDLRPAPIPETAPR